MKPGVLVNRRAGRVARDPELPERLRRLLPRENLRVTANLAEVEPALAALHEVGVDTLVVVGGDGSMTGTLTALLRVWPRESLPRVLLAGGGSVNTIAKSLGARGGPERLLKRLLDGHTQVHVDVRPVLRIQSEGSEPVYGMIFANGAAPRWLEFYYEHSSRGVRGALYSVAATLASVMVNGELAHKLFDPFDALLEIDGEPLDQRQFTTIAAGGVRHIGLGFPLFRSAGEKPGHFHFVATDMQGGRLMRRLPRLRAGSARALDELVHASARRVVIRTPRPMPYTIDAELYPGVGSVTIETGPEIHFLALGDHP